jgi:hypothetical protein
VNLQNADVTLTIVLYYEIELIVLFNKFLEGSGGEWRKQYINQSTKKKMRRTLHSKEH